MSAWPFAFLALAVALFIASFSHLGHDEWTISCKTKGAHLESRTLDGNLHLTIWCVKDGRVVQ